jgi:catalase
MADDGNTARHDEERNVRHRDDEQWPPPQDRSTDRLTTATGTPLPDTDHSLTAGSRGPTLMEDFHFREKITHFDHERIPEATHMLMWVMSDRAIPRSFRMMEGFGIHTFRLVDAPGRTTLAKFHWKPVLGVHSLVWEEAQLAAGTDPDFHRRDLAEAIDAGAYPEWELGLQLMPDTEDQTFEGIDLLDPTEIVPEELAPVRPIGRMTLTRNPSNFFAETEQVAFHVGQLAEGLIEALGRHRVWDRRPLPVP